MLQQHHTEIAQLLATTEWHFNIRFNIETAHKFQRYFYDMFKNHRWKRKHPKNIYHHSLNLFFNMLLFLSLFCLILDGKNTCHSLTALATNCYNLTHLHHWVPTQKENISEIFIYISATCLFLGGATSEALPPDLVNPSCVTSSTKLVAAWGRPQASTSWDLWHAMGCLLGLVRTTGWDHKTMEMYNWYTLYTLYTWPGILLYLVYISGRPLTQNDENTLHFPMNYVRS